MENNLSPKFTLEELISFVHKRKEELQNEPVPDMETERRKGLYAEIEQRLVETQFSERVLESNKSGSHHYGHGERPEWMKAKNNPA